VYLSQVLTSTAHMASVSMSFRKRPHHRKSRVFEKSGGRQEIFSISLTRSDFSKIRFCVDGKGRREAGGKRDGVYIHDPLASVSDNRLVVARVVRTYQLCCGTLEIQPCEESVPIL
jgi:hypothetical protein